MDTEFRVNNFHRTICIILTALALGVIIAGAAIYFYVGEAGPLDNYSLLTMLGLAAAGLAIVMRTAVPPVLVKSSLAQVARSDPEKESELLASAFVTSNIAGAALLEGAAMLNIIVFLLDKNPLSLGIAAALAVAILSAMPSLPSMLDWIENHKHRVHELRSLGPHH